MTSIASTFGVDWPHLTAQLVSFAIVCAALYWFAYRPVLRMLESRRQQIAQGLANTEKINAALASIESQREGVIAEARTHAAQMLADARETARRIQEQEVQRAKATAEQIVLQARGAAAQEHARMLRDLRREVAHLVIGTTAAVVGKVLTAEDEQRLAEETARHLTAA